MHIADNRKPDGREHQVRDGTDKYGGREGRKSVMEVREQRDPAVVVAIDLGDEPSAFTQSEMVRDDSGQSSRGPCSCSGRTKNFLPFM